MAKKNNNQPNNYNASNYHEKFLPQRVDKPAVTIDMQMPGVTMMKGLTGKKIKK